MDYTLIIVALGLVFIIEGIPYAVFPDFVKRYMTEALKLPDATLRWFGIFALLFGLFLIFLGARVLR